MMQLNTNEIAKMIDVSCVRANTTIEDIEEGVRIAKEFDCIAMYALPSHTKFLVELLKDRKDIIIGGAVGYPGGSTRTDVKVYETKDLIAIGSGELDMVINITWLKSGMYDLVKNDILKVKEAAGDIPLKLIIECSYLTDDEIIIASNIGVDCGVEWIKTGTGWASNGASLHHIELISKTIRNGCKIKAAGGIRDKQTLQEMYKLGARRFGLSFTSARSILTDI